VKQAALDPLLHYSLIAVAAVLTLGVALRLSAPRTCAACTAQSPPPRCAASLSELTLNPERSPNVWWQRLMPRSDHTLQIVLGLDHQGTTPVAVTYRIDVDDPAIDRALPAVSREISVRLGPSEADGQHATRTVAIPYAGATTDDLTVSATAIATTGNCTFPSPVVATIHFAAGAPTVWAITPRLCAQAGEHLRVLFGIHNPGATRTSYALIARAFDAFGSQTFSLDGPGDEVRLPPITLGANEARSVTVTCETLGYCLAGGQNRIELEVVPGAVNRQAFVRALAAAHVTIRHPVESCSTVDYWWVMLPPRLIGAFAGIPAVVLAGLYCLRTRRKRLIDRRKDRRG
jgi:hypothetical protein